MEATGRNGKGEQMDMGDVDWDALDRANDAVGKQMAAERAAYDEKADAIADLLGGLGAKPEDLGP